ncbi:DUF2225 domain-containing protein [Clostridium rectalis]|uniref:DUF2225 domain-containing protein n=1 Tax=Clostridium rectalis TaxID=2040295 RepID=UPI000F63A50F|nr:DUF2225 domain-containing protein [Clostridium rectalis]
MSKNIFSELENLGFNNIKNLEIYKNSSGDKIMESNEPKKNTLSPLYNKEIICPVCNNTFQAKAVKSSFYRMLKKDSDFFIRYSSVNPYFYDVWVCNNCGYAALKRDFEKIRDFQKSLVKEKIQCLWHGKSYPDVYNVDIAIERYKLALLNYIIIDAKSSKKAMTCLKIAWMYRLKENIENELLFLKEALNGFNDAYYNEDFPIYGMNKFTTMYLIGELNRRIGKEDTALIWFGNVITSNLASSKIKDLARDQKDIIKEKQTSENNPNPIKENPDKIPTKKKGFLSKLFNRK